MKKNFAWCAFCSLLISVSFADHAVAAGKAGRDRSAARPTPVAFKSARVSNSRKVLAARPSRGAAVAAKSQSLLARGAAASAKAVLPVSLAARAVGASITGDANSVPILNSFIGSKKPLPQRMYAAEGDLFYFNGNKFRVEGVPGELAKQEVTKQRLQQLLDSGEVSIEPRGVDESGLTNAVVRVAGRDVAERLR